MPNRAINVLNLVHWIFVIMKAFDLLIYLFEHIKPGSLIAVKTRDNFTILIKKEDDYTVIASICKENNMRKFKEVYNKATVHRAVLDLLSQISDNLQINIDELEISNNLELQECQPKKETPKKVVKHKERVEDLIVKMKELPPEYDIIPLFTKEGKLVSLVLQNLCLIYIDKIVKGISHIRNDTISNLSADVKAINYVLSTIKFDLQKGNPISSVDNFTFFTAMFIDMGEIGHDVFLGRKMRKRMGKFFTTNNKGNLRPIQLEFLDLSDNSKNELYIGYFLHDGEKFIRIGGYNLFEYHDKGLFTINQYLLSSFTVTQYNFSIDYQSFDKLLSNFVNTVISKGIGSKYVKDIFELENLLYDVECVRSVTKEKIEIIDPISMWYYKTRGEDVKLCNECEVSDKVNLWNKIITVNWFKEFLI
ncbi:hypothetical protein SUSAZ_04015 [Sulfolobus acidocaldarius SUSAZ]|nr:hypothetical protein SUSAZ_04015 [Sulfolobus acidocaldarius SUSAZ]